MLRFLIFAALVAATRYASAQPSDPCTGSLDGHAVDDKTHEPIAGATVRVGDTGLTITDDAGRFSVTGLCRGKATVIVERVDYNTAERTITVSGHGSLEVTMHLLGEEVIEMHDKAPPPPEMRAEAKLSGTALEQTRGQTITAAIAKIPGVSELRAATGVAKPIIRGQFGRRLVFLVDDVRHRAQEWGLEHAPEIDPFMADSIRVVRGAGGVRYGSDAIGGVVIVDPPELRREVGQNAELHLIGSTNGRGGTVAARAQSVFAAVPALSTQFEGSFKRLAAPLAPGYALDNAGALEWTAGATAGYRTKSSEYKLSYRRYRAELGVCSCLRIHNIDDFLAQAQADEPIGADQFRSEFAIDRPKQTVTHDLALARARWERDRVGTFIATYSFQHDMRREYDVVREAVGEAAQFNFRLMTHELDVVFEHNPIHLSEHWHMRGAAGVNGLAQTHEYAGLHLIPSFTAFGGGVFASERLVGHATDIEAGVRYDFTAREADLAKIDFLRLVRSNQLTMDACGGVTGDTVPCESRYHTFSGSLGARHQVADAWTLKGELSIASRAPNTDEQYLNGTAPTFPIFGLGKPDIKPETTYSASTTVEYSTERVKAEASLFANVIDDYIYFAPALGADGKPIFDVLIRGAFPRFTTQPIDALFYGADGGIEAQPHPKLELSAQVSLVRAKNLDTGGYLVFIPADHFRAAATYSLPDTRYTRKSFASISGTYVAKQRRFDIVADFVEPPPPYFLLGAELGTEGCFAGHSVRWALSGANLTNARYRDYTSLMRYFADEPGWQVWLRMSMFLDAKHKERS